MLTEKERPKVVVLVESDGSLRELMKRFLVDQGYSVFAERRTEAALWYFEHPGPLDLLIADVAMPDQNGLMFAHLIRRDYYPTPILLTGDVEAEAGLAEEVSRVGFSFLVKPFKRRQFLNVVADLLGNPAPPSAEDKDDTEGER